MDSDEQGIFLEVLREKKVFCLRTEKTPWEISKTKSTNYSRPENTGIPIQPLGFRRIVELKYVSVFSRGGDGRFFGRGEGDAAVGGHDGFGLDAEFQEADTGFEPAGVPEDGVRPNEVGIGFGDGNLEDDFRAVRGEFF